MDSIQKATNEILGKNKAIDEKANTFIIDLMKAQKSPEFIVEKLVANGYDYQQAYNATHSLYDKVLLTHQVKEKKGAGVDIGLGLLILVIGIGITSTGHVIAYGAIIVGAIKLIRGIANSMS